MEFFCPECMGTLAIRGGSATCTIHGGTYKVLFARGTGVAPALVAPAAAPPTGSCRQHSGTPAAYRCALCGHGLCATCDFPQPNGAHLCPDCIQQPLVSTAEPGPPIPAGLMCVNHPANAAMAHCKVCNAAICATCGFTFPGGVVLCPACATRPAGALSSKRKSLLFWSFGLAALGTLSLLGLLLAAPATERDAEAVGTVFGTAVLVSSLIGTALGVSSFDKRLKNPLLAWIAVTWNGLLLGSFLILSVVGLML